MKSGDVKRGRELLQTDPGGHSHSTQLAGVGLARECLCSAHRTAGACRCDFSNWFENLAKHYLRFQRKNAEVYCAGCTWCRLYLEPSFYPLCTSVQWELPEVEFLLIFGQINSKSGFSPVTNCFASLIVKLL